MRDLPALLALGWVLLCGPGAARAEVLHVPSEVPTLQAAINQADEGDVIELAAGTYPASPRFEILNKDKSFTIRAAPGAQVILDGGGTSDILLFRNNPWLGKSVVFERLIFANGFSDSDARGGVTLDAATATFVGCTFRDYASGQNLGTSSGAIHVIGGSQVFFHDVLWQDNTTKNAGAALSVQNSEIWIHDSRFYNNRNNLPDHRTTAAGGAVHVGTSESSGNHARLMLTNTRFEGNQAGYTGGAVFLIGDFVDPVAIPRAEAEIANCSFVDNRAERDPSVTLNVPTEGGALHAENQSRVRIYNSRFVTNVSDIGGAISLYRAKIEVHDSVFQGNQAVDATSGKPFGGAFKASSNDTNNATTGFGTINRPSGQLTVTDSLIQGRFGAVTTVSESAGGIFAAGDNNRAYGRGGVSQMGTPEENRASLTVEDVIFYDLDVEAASSPRSGRGAGLSANLVDLTLRDSLFIDNDTLGPGNFPQGGGVLTIGESGVLVEGSTFANNTARLGAGLNLQGADLTVSGSQFFANELSAGAPGSLLGAAIYTTPYDDGLGVVTGVEGTVSSCQIDEHVGTPIWDGDNDAGPINDVVYNGNTFHPASPGGNVYNNPLTPAQDVAGLNGLVVVRSGAPNTDKSTAANAESAGHLTLGALKAAPRQIIPVTASGDPETETAAYLGYAWNGGSASLDGNGLGSQTGLLATTAGTHTLSVDGTDFQAQVLAAPAPAATFQALPAVIPPGGSSTLSWSVDAGTFVAMAIDQGVAVTSAAAGSVEVFPEATTTYRLFALTEEGGTVKTVTVTIGGPELIFADGFESGDTSAWSSTRP